MVRGENGQAKKRIFNRPDPFHRWNVLLYPPENRLGPVYALKRENLRGQRRLVPDLCRRGLPGPDQLLQLGRDGELSSRLYHRPHLAHLRQPGLYFRLHPKHRLQQRLFLLGPGYHLHQRPAFRNYQRQRRRIAGLYQLRKSYHPSRLQLVRDQFHRRYLADPRGGQHHRR